MKLIQDILKKIGSSIEPCVSGDGLNSIPIGQTTPAAGKFTNIEAPVGRCATFTVAASNSSTLSKQQADYVCDGTDDNVQIQLALDSLTNGRLGKERVLCIGDFTLNNTLYIRDSFTILQIDGSFTAAATFGVYEHRFGSQHFVEIATDVCFVDITGGIFQGNKANVGVNCYHLIGLYIHHRTVNCPIFIDQRIWIRDLHIGDFSEHGFDVRSRRSMFEHCTSNHNDGLGFAIQQTDQTFIDCIAQYNGEDGFEINGEWNHFIKCISAWNTQQGFNIGPSGDNTVIYGGYSEWNTLDGIYINALAKYSNISAMKIIANSRNGISLNGDYNIITGNRIFGVSAEQDSAINFDSAAQSNIISMNHIHDNVAIFTGTIDATNIIYNKYSDLFMDVLAVSTTHIRSNEDLSAATPITFTLDAQPDIPRTLSWSFDSHAQITEYDMEVIGVDAKGNSVTETWDETAGWSGETSNAFATITSIKMTSRTGTGAADTMDIGITDVLGLSNIIYSTSDVFKIKKNNANATVATAQVNTTYDTYDMSVITLGAGDDFTIWYKSNLNIIS